MRLRVALVAGSAMLAALVAGACGGAGAGGRDLTAVATTTQLGDFVRTVGRGRVDVRQVVKPNSDPHDYEPRPSDARAMSRAKVVFRSGGEVDEWLEDLIENAGGEAREVTVGEAVRLRHGDPHWWQDPRNVELAVGVIRDSLAKVDPGGSSVYRRNASRYTARLRRLDRSVRRCIQRVPPGERRLVTSHEALGYYARRYGIEVVGALIPALSSQAQPSTGDTARLVDRIEREHVKAIFPESSLNPRLERAVARETGARVGGALWADTLGPAGSSGATYLESIQSNTAELVKGLTGGAVACRPSA
jgi:ABC-type Zn uptake system ZnuABC Zn-binding protein ZnuA